MATQPGSAATPQQPPSTPQVKPTDTRAMGKQSVNEESLFERYRGPLGMSLTKFLKLFRDTVLLDNSWTLAQAVSCFFHVAEQSEWGHDGGVVNGRPVQLLTLEGFTVALKRFSRISSTVAAEAARGLGEDPEDGDYVRWEALKKIMGERLQATPKSAEDSLLVDVILSEQVQLVCLQNEFRLRRVYKRLVQAQSWDQLASNPQLKYAKADVQQFIRNFIPKDYGGPLRQEDLGNVIRYANHENSSKEQGARDTSSGDAVFPEFMEMTIRVALGSIQLTFPAEDSNDDADVLRGFEPEKDDLEYAIKRILAVWRILWEWLDTEQDKDEVGGLAPDEPLMEECPAYDNTFTDVQMLFAHYSTGQPYSQAMDFTDPQITMQAHDVFRLCRDASIMDDNVTFCAVARAFKEVLHHPDDWMAEEVGYGQWQQVMVKLARAKYRDNHPLESIALLLRKWLIPMVNVEVEQNELTDFIFSPSIISVFLTYEPHVQRIMLRFATTREITIGEDGDESNKDLEEPWPEEKSMSRRSSASKKMVEGLGEKQPSFILDADLDGSPRRAEVTKIIQVVTLIDFVALLKALSFLTELIAVDEVPEIFDSVLNAIPAHQTPINEGGLFVSQILIALLQIALLAFSRPPYATKFATREEKLLTTIERVEVAYYALFGKFMPLSPPPSYPTMHLRLEDLTQESELRNFLLARRLQRGIPLVAVDTPSKKTLLDETELMPEPAKLGSRQFVPMPEAHDGHRPSALGIPCLIREQLFAPEAPHPVGPLMETALIHHNAARYKAAAETYLQALHTWAEMLAEESAGGESSLAGTATLANTTLASTAGGSPLPEADGNASREELADDESPTNQSQSQSPMPARRAAKPEPAPPPQESAIPAGLYLYFFVALGGVYESATLQELALACYSEGRLVGDTLEGTPEAALAYGAIAGTLFHLGQYPVALAFFEKALAIREQTLGEVHMDTGLLYNNMGACYDMLNRVTEAIESFQRARDVFQFQFGMSHPRTATCIRNLTRVKTRRFDFTVSFAERKPTPCPPSLLGKPKAKKGGKKGAKGKKGGKKKK